MLFSKFLTDPNSSHPPATAVSNKLRELSTTTDILSENPTTLQEEVMKAIQNSKSLDSPR